MCARCSILVCPWDPPYGSYLREKMPWMYGRARRRRELLENIERVFETVSGSDRIREEGGGKGACNTMKVPVLT